MREEGREVGDLGSLMTPCLSRTFGVMYDHTVEKGIVQERGERERGR